MGKIYFSSNLDESYRAQLEALIFFNPLQSQVEPGILESIERYGIPKVAVKGEGLRVQVEGLAEVQTLFALERSPAKANLVGVLVYVRLDQESIVILHIGVCEQYSIFGIYADKMLAMRLIVKLRQIARQIKGVRSLAVIYGQGVIREIPVND